MCREKNNMHRFFGAGRYPLDFLNNEGEQAVVKGYLMLLKPHPVHKKNGIKLCVVICILLEALPSPQLFVVVWCPFPCQAWGALQDTSQDHRSKRPRLTPFISPHVLEATKEYDCRKPVTPTPLGELLLENYASGKNAATTVPR